MGDFAAQAMERWIARTVAALGAAEQAGADGPLLPLRQVTDKATPAGHVRRWALPAGPADRVVHFRLLSAPVDTQLLFLFGRPDTAMPHLHLQVVQFGEDACVYNVDWLPRLDPVDAPDYYTRLFRPLDKPYWRITGDAQNTCSRAPANPAIALYLSPWSFGANRPTNRAELERAGPAIETYLEHWLALASGTLDYPAPPDLDLRARDGRHLAQFFSEDLDPRAWKGVYRVIGEEAGREVRRLLMTPLN
jgi:hypothetical protein